MIYYVPPSFLPQYVLTSGVLFEKSAGPVRTGPTLDPVKGPAEGENWRNAANNVFFAMRRLSADD